MPLPLISGSGLQSQRLTVQGSAWPVTRGLLTLIDTWVLRKVKVGVKVLASSSHL